jgi:hypothetical protein
MLLSTHTHMMNSKPLIIRFANLAYTLCLSVSLSHSIFADTTMSKPAQPQTQWAPSILDGKYKIVVSIDYGHSNTNESFYGVPYSGGFAKGEVQRSQAII